MTYEEYLQYGKRYGIYCMEAFEFALRQHAYDELDAQIEMYYENNWDEWNGGAGILDALTPEKIEEIIDDYIGRFGNEGQWMRERMIKNAIQDVTDLIC